HPHAGGSRPRRHVDVEPPPRLLRLGGRPRPQRRRRRAHDRCRRRRPGRLAHPAPGSWRRTVMSTLEDVLDLVPLAARKALATRESNVALLPATAPTAVRHGTLVHNDAGPPGDDTPPTRVIAILGPGATFRGIAEAV